MAKHIISTIITAIAFVCLATVSHAKQLTFTAKYDVFEDNTIKASLTSNLKKLNNNHYQLTDTTVGTAGLASFLNFKRTEQTDFIYLNNKSEVLSHSMTQKVAFKNKHYQYQHQPGTFSYQGLDKNKPFQLSSQHPLLSTHLLSWQLAQQVCHNPNETMQWPVLKSQDPKLYSFKIIAVDNHKTLVHRQYPNHRDKSTAIWINTKDCYIEQIIYQDDGKTVRTVINDIVFN